MSKKLTKAQMSVLIDLSADQGAWVYANTYKPILALLALGFAERYTTASTSSSYLITDTGRAILAEASHG